MDIRSLLTSRAGRLVFGVALLAVVLVVTLGVAGVFDSEAGNETDVTLNVSEPLIIVRADGTRVQLYAEIAETPEQRAEGLMNRTELAPNSGMLFAIDPPGRGFWMKDTEIALTVAFIGPCGELVDFADLEPLSEEVKNTDQPYSFALEMTQGWFAENGIVAGDVIQLPERLLPDSC
jgi:uncharacterized membrane protein (UPF0127 family)